MQPPAIIGVPVHYLFVFHMNHTAFSSMLLQMSLAAVHSWPFIMQPPPIIEVLVKQTVAAQQQDNSDTDDDA